MDTNDEEFGEARLADLVENNLTDTANELINKILAAVKQHSGDSPQMDDMTIVVIKRKNAE